MQDAGLRAARDPQRAARTIRHEIGRTTGAPPSCMLNHTGSDVMSAGASLEGWRHHFASVGQTSGNFYDACAAEVGRLVEQYSVEARQSSGPLDQSFVEGELLAARQSLRENSQPGEDLVPY